jgi:DNA polymerase IIIc chi subunit
VSRADFYQLKSDDPASRYPLLCRLLEKCLDAGQQVYILCGDEVEALHLNQYIWAFKPDSFTFAHTKRLMQMWFWAILQRQIQPYRIIVKCV